MMEETMIWEPVKGGVEFPGFVVVESVPGTQRRCVLDPRGLGLVGEGDKRGPHSGRIDRNG